MKWNRGVRNNEEQENKCYEFIVRLTLGVGLGTGGGVGGGVGCGVATTDLSYSTRPENTRGEKTH